MSARLLETISVAKPWGREHLPGPFVSAHGEKTGEIWFDPPPEWPDVLVKYLFTSENLSVQVHPDDASAPEGSRGKEECWLVLDAEPGASLAAGFTRKVDAAEMRTAASDGSIETLLDWHQVERGDFFNLPARTVHAIGAGLSILEIQQNSDITYRLYDYGRPRELHLDEAVAVAEGAPYAAENRKHFDLQTPSDVVRGRYFAVAIVGDGTGEGEGDGAAAEQQGDRLYLPLTGSVTAAGTVAVPGSCIFVRGNERAELAAGATAVLVRRPRNDAP